MADVRAESTECGECKLRRNIEKCGAYSISIAAVLSQTRCTAVSRNTTS